jgi:hypothetical protein
MNDKFGKMRHWPPAPVTRFARVIRNAMSHDGKLAMADKSQQPSIGISLHIRSRTTAGMFLALIYQSPTFWF